MKADIHTTPKGFRGQSYTIPRFAFMLRVGSWKLDRTGLYRWWSFKAAKAMKNGTHAMRYGWKRVYPKHS